MNIQYVTKELSFRFNITLVTLTCGMYCTSHPASVQFNLKVTLGKQQLLIPLVKFRAFTFCFF